MREINEIIIHCTATRTGAVVHVADVDRWHRQRGWAGIGYHFLVQPDGAIEVGRPLEKPGAHCRGHNRHSVGIAYVGGLDAHGHPADTRTPEQTEAIAALCARFMLMFNLTPADIHGHNHYNPHKACPCYNVEQEWL